MPKFNIDLAHGQDRAAVVEKLRSFLQSAIDDKPDVVSEVEESWDDEGNLDFAFSAMGFRVAGKVVTDEEYWGETTQPQFSSENCGSARN